MPKPSATHNPKVDAYIAKSAPFAQPILEYLREIVHEAAPLAVEEIKWSRPFFVIDGVILGNISAFKSHCSFGLWGPEIAAKLRADGVHSAEGMGTFGKIASVEDLPARRKLLTYVHEAARKIATGERPVSFKRPRVAKPEPEVPAILTAALKKNKAAATNFATMSPSCRREYCAWIADAKREETQLKRVATALEWIAEGKSRHWKYEQPA
jgi:uncharacterized protein YdeI (YjbR/CyaY-like superfamily)